MWIWRRTIDRALGCSGRGVTHKEPGQERPVMWQETRRACVPKSKWRKFISEDTRNSQEEKGVTPSEELVLPERARAVHWEYWDHLARGTLDFVEPQEPPLLIYTWTFQSAAHSQFTGVTLLADSAPVPQLAQYWSRFIHFSILNVGALFLDKEIHFFLWTVWG